MLSLKNITKDYIVGDTKINALKGINIDFRKSEFVAILGPSGCGKTTLLNLIGGLDKYSTGDLIINGVSTKEFNDSDWDAYRNNSIGFVFQNYNLIMHQSVLKNVELSLTLSGMPKEIRRKKAIEALEKVGLKDQINKKPNQLSGGQMQRVAIARAIIGDPDIILADEPTGALDSNTSIQVMEILKELSKTKLVIMVTHNPELANKYATRIVKLLDGEVVDDSMDFKSEFIKIDKPKRKTAMNILTAFSLSLNNLLTKKGRTILTVLAGSIGIIGISLVLALSTGFQRYIDEMQSDTMSSYPITITKNVANYESILNYEHIELEEFSKIKKIYINELLKILLSMKKTNEITLDYLENVIEKIPQEYLQGIVYDYGFNLPIYKKIKYGSSEINSKVELAIPGFSSVSQIGIGGIWTELIGDEKTNLEKYDLLYGTYPKNKNEVVLIVNKYNQISDIALNVLGFDNSIIEEIDGKKNIDFAKVIGHEFKLVFNDSLYSPVKDSDNKITHYKLNNTSGNYISDEAYNNPMNETIKVSGIIRISEESKNNIANPITTLGYTKELVKHILNVNLESDIVKFQKENKNIDALTGLEFNVSVGLSEKEQYENSLSLLSGNLVPISISIYPKDFASKDLIKDFLDKKNIEISEKVESDAYYQLGLKRSIELEKYPNENISESDKRDFYISLGKEYSTLEEKDLAKSSGMNAKIQYSDLMSIMVSVINNVVDTISYVLIAFTSISLVVSSMMIGIITYISVIERTKEIGILRSVGARKRDITRVFNAETFIIGFSSGIFGVSFTWLLTIPINIILYNLTSVKNISYLNPLHALIIIIISFSLTLIAGTIPSKIASKKDPVTALRTE